MNIVLDGISKSYGKTTVFNDFSLEIKKGKLTCIMGPSGVGKTTLLNILLGLEKLDSGSVIGLDKKKVVAVFQENRLVDKLDSIRNIQLVCKRNFNVEKLLEDFRELGLEGLENKPVFKLSGGMKRRLAIVRAVFVDSDVILMDEPFKGLDLELKKKVIKYVKKNTIGKTVILVTHDIKDVKELNAEKIQLNFTNKTPNDIIYT